MSFWKTYPPAQRDKTVYIFIGIACVPLVAAQVLVSHYGKPAAGLAFGLALLALLVMLLGPVVKWRRWSRDPGFQEFVKAKRALIREKFGQS